MRRFPSGSKARMLIVNCGRHQTLRLEVAVLSDSTSRCHVTQRLGSENNGQSSMDHSWCCVISEATVRFGARPSSCSKEHVSQFLAMRVISEAPHPTATNPAANWKHDSTNLARISIAGQKGHGPESNGTRQSLESFQNKDTTAGSTRKDPQLSTNQRC